MNTNQNNYNALDLCKWVMAIFVIAIHTGPLYGVKSELLLTLYNSVIQVAVPTFFMASGFLLFHKMDGYYGADENLKVIKKYIQKILKLYCVWTVIFLPITLYHFVSSGNSILKNLWILVRGFLFLGEQYYSWHLWYLLSLLLSASLIYLLLKKSVKENTVILLSILFFAFALIMNSFIKNTENLPAVLQSVVKVFVLTFSNTRLFTGVTFFAAGMMIAKYKIKIRPAISIPFLVLGFLGYSFLTAGWSSIGKLLYVIMFFEVILNLKLPYSDCWYKFRKASSVMYFTHMLFFFLYSRLVCDYGIGAFLVTFFATQILSIFIIKFENNPYFKWSKKIF